MLSSIREWMNGNHGSIMLIVMGLHRDLVNHNKNHSSSKTSSKPTIHESLVVFSVISCEDENQGKTLHKLHLHNFRRLLTVSFSFTFMLFIIKDCLYA